ncbi:molybdopterin-synthase adenylyltransferase MoeB [Aliiglaciecola litoralis]|uniref:Molybdopterin-synthase adenylyltransferase MoeB n=1 Tax=Aliiglaciecola litoralis TaxID=582857 RepID=A0ABN1LD48_9ALTE
MTNQLTPKQAMRYSRHIMLPGFDLEKQEQLLASRVLLIGVGGLGCAAAQYLVASGVGELTLVDDDLVDASNLQRQVLHGESDVGISKCASARDSLSKLNSATKLNCVEQRLNDQELLERLQQHDLVLDCSDNLTTRNQLNTLCWKTNTALVSGAAIRMEGQLFCVLPAQQSACYACVSHFFGEQSLTCSEAGVMSPVVGVIGALQALEAIKILVNYGEPLLNTLLLFDAATQQWQRFNVPKRADCQTCGCPAQT